MIAIPKPLEIITTTQVDQSRPVAEQRIWLENISWQTFERLLEDIGDRQTLKEFRQWVSDNLKKS
ncbi:hypothetical protein H6F42_03170 [Pseudanabaena sp. FACHB-1998]|uniref:hypothetical protein n=1 Tax=Pseudanabaena sp. FACHB-1998 TaxID=2692858 RepID=UPI00168094AC|nr:hypothetical protein [Pseudanabaena sp. FACHB-1998]MBD2175920.1 hypothetical protein [Pseudanabaena sp. FACHB-1998]